MSRRQSTARIHVPLFELEQLCGRCGHQNGAHTGGASKSGWAIYESVWATASGWCSADGCDCPGRVSISVERPKPSGSAPVRLPA